MRTILLSTFAVIATSALAPASAGPMPLNPAVSADSGLTLVRDGCGRGFRFSYRRQACVPIDGYGGGGYVDPGAAAAAAIAAGVAGAIIGGNRGGGYRGGHGGGNYRGGGGGGQRIGGGGGGPRVGGPGGGNRSQGFAGPPQNWKKPGTGIR